MEEKKTTTDARDAKSRRPTSRRPRPKREEKEFEQRILELSRVTRVMAGGKRMSFRACVAIGDRKGRLGVGLAKGADVTAAIAKAATRAEKTLITIPITNGTIPHRVDVKFGAASLMIKPAPHGTGIRAGGIVRVMLEVAGVPNAVSKIFGAKNKVNNAKATLLALQSFKMKQSSVRKKAEKKTPIVEALVA